MSLIPIPSIAILGDYGWGGDYARFNVGAAIAAASNIVVGTNPPYTVADFLAVYPQFGGTSSTLTGALTQGSNILVGAQLSGFGTGGFGQGGFGVPVPPPGGEPGQTPTPEPCVITYPPIPGLAVGQLVIGPGIPSGTLITAVTPIGNPVTSTNVTLSNNVTASANPATLTVYTAPLVPIGVLSLYVTLASASILQARWMEVWPLGMALFIAHYATLYARTSGNPATTAGQLAASGAMLGFQTSKAAGDVSSSQQAVMLEAFADFGAYNLTAAGQQLITWMKSITIPVIWVP